MSQTLTATQIHAGKTISRDTATYAEYETAIRERGASERAIDSFAYLAYEEGESVTDFVERAKINRQTAIADARNGC